MPPEAVLPGPAHRLLPDVPAIWRHPLTALAMVWGLLLGAFARDWAAMADQWWNSSTYTHVLLIPPILIWLVWQRGEQLRSLAPGGWWPGLILFAGAVLLWVLGAFAGLDIARQLGADLALIAATLTLLGPKVGRALAFPLAYMLFLVPFGDELVPQLQLITAKLTIWLVQLTGVPARVDGVFIATPAGLFEVAEACSGAKFLIAMIAFGVLACHVCFRSWTRRAGFMALAIAAPVLANGVRAWGTIYLAQWYGADVASGVDHIIYGWVFFALVIALVIGIGWRFFDRPPGDPLVDLAAIESSPLLAKLADRTIASGKALVAIAVILLAGGGWALAADRLSARLPEQVFLPDVPGWQRTSYSPKVWWEPRAAGADHRLLGSYVDTAGNRVDVFYALYSGQSEGREAGGFGEGALTPDSDWAWLAPGTSPADAHGDRLLASSGTERLAQTQYRTGALLTGSNARLKLANIADRMLLRARPTMLLILSAERGAGDPPDKVISRFRAATGPTGAWMDRLAGIR